MDKLLFCGENLTIMTDLIENGYENKFKLIYFDGPFNSGRIFAIETPELGVNLIQSTNELETMNQYLNPSLYVDEYKKRFLLAKKLLREDGVLVVQNSNKEVHAIKIALDEAFGRKNFLNEYIWKFANESSSLDHTEYNHHNHEAILFYRNTFTEVKKKININHTVWDDVGMYEELFLENTNYPSQKPEKLIRRILEMTANKGDLIGDFYCGSGTTVVVAEKLGLNWVASDINLQAVSLTKSRLSNAGVEVEVIFLETDDIAVIKVPVIDKNGISTTMTTEIEKPKIVEIDGEIKLIVSNPFEWILHNIQHVEKKDEEYIFDWTNICKKIDYIIKKIGDDWIIRIEDNGNHRLAHDIFGHPYKLMKSSGYEIQNGSPLELRVESSP
ncbi:site-specific DNA-methyltransferase [Paenibacillus psychroresistens]|uniref:Site-specific DNA-methyltransferase n=1 Tax=Paenibacillus psychroresistens TaxID=1778678 RepID=A0A6B8RK21_9BACL|nr:site-specific DNA-methyltransferase [Paenibacillus psychroresistens]QGQ96094.1 site-specific DNA-methyltransferase [Paenibacillus psychroresistens]